MPTSKNQNSLFNFFATLTAIIFTILLFLLIRNGDQTYPKVRNFTTKESQILIQFNREMDKKSVEENLIITPEIDGKISWIGRTMAFSTSQNFSPSTNYKISLKGSKDSKDNLIAGDTTFSFQTPDPTLLFVGSKGEEAGRILSYNFQEKTKKTLTPKELSVVDYQIHPDKKRLIFLAIDREEEAAEKLPTEFQKLYELNFESGEIELLADNDGFVNVYFSLSPDGNYLALYRVQVDKNRVFEDSGLWFKAAEGRQWARFWKEDVIGYPFFFTPDSRYILSTDINGFLLIPLSESDEKPEFLGNFYNAYGFSPDGSMAIFNQLDGNNILSNQGYLLILRNDGTSERIAEGLGNSINPIFSSDSSTVYFQLTADMSDISQDDNPVYHTYKYDIENKKVEQLFDDILYSEKNISIDTYNQKLIAERDLNFTPEREYELWILDTDTKKLEKLKLNGSLPKWLN